MSILYLDSSAALKRVVSEEESPAVAETLRAHHREGTLVVASALAWLEVWRSLRRLRHAQVETAARLAMSGVDVVPLDQVALDAARHVGDDGLRSFDAIHLVSAVMVGARSMLTFDARLAVAARAAGIDVPEV